jgi:hypothetical protein
MPRRLVLRSALVESVLSLSRSSSRWLPQQATIVHNTIASVSSLYCQSAAFKVSQLLASLQGIKFQGQLLKSNHVLSNEQPHAIQLPKPGVQVRWHYCQDVALYI